VHFDIAPPNARMVFELAPGGIEGVVYGHIDVLMSTPRLRLAPNHDFAAGDGEVDANPEQIALMVPPVLALDGDPAGHDLVAEPAELLGVLAYPLLDRGGGIGVSESDLQWQAHRVLPLSANAIQPPALRPELN